MARGKATDILIERAVSILSEYFTPKEIMTVLKLPSRTTYDIIERTKKAKKQIELELIEREQRRQEREAALNLEPEWQQTESKPSFLNIRKFYS
jgi:hypothetical protein